MSAQIARLRRSLGPLGLAALALLLAVCAFRFALLDPMAAQAARLQARAASERPGMQAVAPGGPGDKVAAVYAFLQKEELPTDWLAKLHGIGAATGVQLKSASYRSEDGAGRILRYEIVLPASGSYSQIRDFLGRALAEIPVLSVDQIKLRRENRSDGVLQAELRMTLHMVKS